MMREVDPDVANQAAEATEVTSVPTDGPGSQANCTDGACQDPTSEDVEGCRNSTSEYVGEGSLSSETPLKDQDTSEDGTDSCECSLRPREAGAGAADSANLRVLQNVCRLQGWCPPMNSPEDGGTVALPAAANGGIRDDMFFVGIQIQNRWTWAMFDMGASKSLVSTKFFSQLFHQPDLRPPGAMRIVAGNGAALDLRGWTTLIVSIDGHWLIHEFGVVGDMPLDAVC